MEDKWNWYLQLRVQEKNVYLSDPGYGICGILDEILFFEDGKISLLDYKFAYNSHKFKTQFLQNVFYSLC
jgi:hypothetical protein